MIETTRLLLQPLTYAQLQKYLQNDYSLEEELMLRTSPRTITAELQEALEETIMPNVADPSKNYLFCTLWTAISKADQQMVGDLCIVGEPNAEGEITIGYGTYDTFQGRGFMTETVGGIIGWVKTQPSVKSITATTNKTNIASYKVLERNNFVKIGESDEELHWKLNLDTAEARDSENSQF